MAGSFDFEEESEPRTPRRRAQAGHGGSAFSTMFGGSLGCFAAVALLVVGGFVASALMCAGCFGTAVMLKSPPTKAK